MSLLASRPNIVRCTMLLAAYYEARTMTAMERADENGRASPAVILASLGTACLFEVLTVLATQDKTVRAASPWQDDPYDAVVSLTQFAVPMLALVIALRLLAWRSPGGPDASSRRCARRGR
jgi:hypothetical protein